MKHINLRKKQGYKKIFCNNFCTNRYYHEGKVKIINCDYCAKEFSKNAKHILRHKNSFCGKSCATRYKNEHTSSGHRRSKLELYLEKELLYLYPNLPIVFNDRQTIMSELDIYFPSLKLGFELNGIYHYQPIYGQKKLQYVQDNDKRKYQACLQKNISLYVFDTSQDKRFTEKQSNKYLKSIIDIVNSKI